MIHRLFIRSFRSCSDVQIDNMSDLTLLVGRNGAGKTNVLKAIEWLAKSISGQLRSEDGEEVREDELMETKHGQAEVEFTISGRRLLYRQIRDTTTQDEEAIETFREHLVDLSGSSPIEIFDRHNSKLRLGGEDFQIGEEIGSVPALISIRPQEDAVRALASDIRDFFMGVRYYALFDLKPSLESLLFRESEYKKWLAGKAGRVSSGRELAFKLFRAKAEDNAALEELQALLGENGVGLLSEIKFMDFHHPGMDHDSKDGGRFQFVSYKPIGQKRYFPYSDLSFGTRRVLHLLAHLVLDKYSVALIEQPEDGVHSGLLYKIADLVRNYAEKGQFIVATHSSVLLNSIAPEEVRLVESVDGTTTVRPLSSEEVEAAKQFLADEGALASFVELIGG